MRKPLRFPTRCDTNQAVQPQKMNRGLKFWIKEVEGLYYGIFVAKTKVLISCVVTTQLICAFVFASFLMIQLINASEQEKVPSTPQMLQ